MARANPDKQLEELHGKRVALAKRRHELGDLESAAGRVLDAVPDRRRAVLLAEARGEQPSESVEQVEIDRRGAEVRAHEAHERIEALRVVEREVQDEVDAVIDGNLAHFVAEADAASREAVEAMDTARAALVDAHTAWQHAAGEWGTIRSSRYRQQWPALPSIPTADLASLTSAFDSARRSPWPGGKQPSSERLKRAAQDGEWDRPAETAPRLGNREAIARFEAA